MRSCAIFICYNDKNEVIVKRICHTVSGKFFFHGKEIKRMKRKWTKQSAQEYIKTAKIKGLTYWSAMDYLKHHKRMYSII